VGGVGPDRRAGGVESSEGRGPVRRLVEPPVGRIRPLAGDAPRWRVTLQERRGGEETLRDSSPGEGRGIRALANAVPEYSASPEVSGCRSE